jgi:hypothetical protein
LRVKHAMQAFGQTSGLYIGLLMLAPDSSARSYGPGAILLSPSTAGHIGEPTTPPPIAPARAPPLWQFALDQSDTHDLNTSDPAPVFEFDQRISW